MSAIYSYTIEDLTAISNIDEVDCYLYFLDINDKCYHRITDSSALIAGNRIFQSLAYGSGIDNIPLNLSFDNSKYYNTYITYGGICLQNDKSYKSDGAMIMYFIDPNTSQLSKTYKIHLLDNTNSQMGEETFINPFTFMNSSCYVNLDDDNTSAMFISVGGLDSLKLLQDPDYIYDYTESYDKLSYVDQSTIYDMYITNVRMGSTGWTLYGYGGRDEYGGSTNYGYKYNIRTRKSNKQKIEALPATTSREFFCHHLGYTQMHGDDFWGTLFNSSRTYSIPIYSNRSYVETNQISSYYNGLFFGYNDKICLYGGNTGYQGNYDTYAFNIENNTQTLLASDYSYIRSTPAYDMHNGKAYIFGGGDQNYTVTTSVVMFDPNNNSFTQVGSMPVGLTNHTATFVGNRVYIIGGRNSDGDMNTNIYEQDINSNIQRIVKTGVRPRCDHQCIEYDGTIYIIGGRFSYSYDSSIYCDIDIFVVRKSNDTIQKQIDIPSNINLSSGARVIEYNGEFYFYGGIDSDGTTMVKFSPSTNEQTKLASNTESLTSACDMVAHNGVIYITGGFDQNASNKMYRYNISSDSQNEAPVVPIAHKESKLLATDGTIQLRIGKTESEYSSNFYSFDITSDTQIEMSSGLTARSKFGFVNDGTYFWVFGGKNTDNSDETFTAITNIERYDPTTNSQENHSTPYVDTSFIERSRSLYNNPFIKDGKIYIFGGKNTDGRSVMTCDVFNPNDGSFILGEGIFGGGEGDESIDDAYNETIGSYIVGDRFYVFYKDSTIGGVCNLSLSASSSQLEIKEFNATGFIDAALFEINNESYNIKSDTFEVNQIYAVNPYSERFGHKSAVIDDSKILVIGGALRRTIGRIDLLNLNPMTINANLSIVINNGIDMVSDFTLSDGSLGLETLLTGKPNGFDFGIDNTAGEDGQYVILNIPNTNDITNIILEVFGGGVARIVMHYPGQESIIDKKTVFPSQTDLSGISSTGPICVYLGIPKGTIIQHIQCI